MKTLLLLCIAPFISQHIFAQDSTSNKYLMVYIQQVWNKTNSKYNYIIQADPDIPEAAPIYALKPVLFKKEIDNDPVYPATTYKSPLQDYKTGYNNFPSESAILNFITANGWQLLSAIPEIRTQYNYYNTQNNYNVYSLTKYLFTKAIK